MRFSVFTPAFNRGHTLDRLFRSLQRQTMRDFEWIIVDDGSTDDTEERVRQYMYGDHDFRIIYQKTENGGKHRAINLGAKIATGELFFIVDSDDWLPEDALERISYIEHSIPEEKRDEYAGVCGLIGESCDSWVGSSFSGDILDVSYLERKQHGIYGDKAEVYYTKRIKDYPFPEFEGERFIPESVVWNEIAAAGYKLRYFNKIVYYCKYLPDGLTAQGERKIRENPIGYGLLIQQNVAYCQISGITKWNEIRKYYRLLKPDHSLTEIAHNIKWNPVALFLRMKGMALYHWIYR